MFYFVAWIMGTACTSENFRDETKCFKTACGIAKFAMSAGYIQATLEGRPVIIYANGDRTITVEDVNRNPIAID